MMFPLKKILCPLDFSDYSVKALKISMEMAEKFKATVIMCHIVTDIPGIGTTYGMVHYNTPWLNLKAFMQEMEKASYDSMDQLIEKYNNKNVSLKKKVAAGMPADEIIKLAEEEQTDLIVLTTHGRTGLKRIFLGSVAEGVIRHASCPVLSIRINKAD
ncbi:universal stress protein [bacterium]|nr:universal stress protein [bacterium]